MLPYIRSPYKRSVVYIPVSNVQPEHPHGGADGAAPGISAAAPVGPPRHVSSVLVGGVLLDDDVGLGAQDLFVEGL